MQSKRAFLIASILLATAASAHAAAPSITATFPVNALVADGPSGPGIHSLELDGDNLALPTTNGYTIDSDVTVYVKYSTDASWAVVSRTDPWARPYSWSPSSNTFTLVGLPHGGTLQTYLCVRTQGCAYHEIFVRDWSNASPYLFSPDNTDVIAFTSSDSPSDTRRLLYFSPSDLNDERSTCFYISGYGFVTALGNLDAGDGWGRLWLPNLSVGDHWIYVSNNGCAAGRWSNGRVIHAKSAWTIIVKNPFPF
jgi:hypothetical protein